MKGFKPKDSSREKEQADKKEKGDHRDHCLCSVGRSGFWCKDNPAQAGDS